MSANGDAPSEVKFSTLHDDLKKQVERVRFGEYTVRCTDAPHSVATVVLVDSTSRP